MTNRPDMSHTVGSLDSGVLYQAVPVAAKYNGHGHLQDFHMKNGINRATADDDVHYDLT